MAHSPVTRLDLFTVETSAIPKALLRMANDRRALHRLRDVQFWKLLGTGDGRTFDVRDADLRRWGLLTVWPGEQSARHFADVRPSTGWHHIATEHWWALLSPVRVKGQWSRREPFGPARIDAGAGQPIAALTRARLRWSRVGRFWRAVPPVNADLSPRDGLLLRMGIGEAPVGLQGTFSLWRDASALHAFAYGGQRHRAVIARSAREHWYAEELFARFAVIGHGGSIFSTDPLASVQAGAP